MDSEVDQALIPLASDTEDVAQLNQIRLRLEELYRQVLEKQYASEQTEEEQVKEILEWTVWRAFLAINHLVNEPYQARRFKVDQDFLPLGTAPGGGPDMIFEFEGLLTTKLKIQCTKYCSNQIRVSNIR